MLLVRYKVPTDTEIIDHSFSNGDVNLHMSGHDEDIWNCTPLEHGVRHLLNTYQAVHQYHCYSKQNGSRFGN
jgi:hypothetical protein